MLRQYSLPAFLAALFICIFSMWATNYWLVWPGVRATVQVKTLVNILPQPELVLYAGDVDEDHYNLCMRGLNGNSWDEVRTASADDFTILPVGGFDDTDYRPYLIKAPLCVHMSGGCKFTGRSPLGYGPFDDVAIAPPLHLGFVGYDESVFLRERPDGRKSVGLAYSASSRFTTRMTWFGPRR